ncbi:MAG: FkbM family methyltransferase [Candidatus Dojkabacteria bacterium]
MANQINMQKYRAPSWFERNGDKTYRLDYHLDKDSVVFDVGGYLGQSTADVHEKFGSKVYVFEPVKEYADKISERFKGNENIFVYPFALSDKNETTTINLFDDKTSTFKSGQGQTLDIESVRISEFIKENKIKKIDLIEINIEGGEYSLLTDLIETGLINDVENIQVQFHDFVEDAEKRMLELREKLNKTHYLTFQYEFIWENWKKRPANMTAEVYEEQSEYDKNELRSSRKEVIDLRIVKEELEGSLSQANEEKEKLKADLYNTQLELSDYKQQFKKIQDTLVYKLGKSIKNPKKAAKELISPKADTPTN